MPSDNSIDIPILSEIIPDELKAGTLFLVEFDPESEWLAIATTMTAGYLHAGGRAAYIAELRSPETVRENLFALGVDVSVMSKEGRFWMVDRYSATLTGGRLEGEGSSVFEPMDGGIRFRSLKLSDLSIQWLKEKKQGHEPWDVVDTWPPGALAIGESISQLLRFNEEKPYLEFIINRGHPNERKAKRIKLMGILRDVHTQLFYRQLENDYDGVIDLRTMERDNKRKTFLRVRSLKGQAYDARWHEVQIRRNGEAALAPYLPETDF